MGAMVFRNSIAWLSLLVLLMAPISQNAAPTNTPVPEIIINLKHKPLVFDTSGELPSEPAGCLNGDIALNMSITDRLDYARRINPGLSQIFARPLDSILNPIVGKRELFPKGVLGFIIPFGIPYYEIDLARRSLHVAGFAAWIRVVPAEGIQLMAVFPTVEVYQRTHWLIYYQQYWENSAAPSFDPFLLPISPQVPPCTWQQSSGLVPLKPYSYWFRGWTWAYPDYSHLVGQYLAGSTQAANQVAYNINWVENGDMESPSNMCGPLTWSIINDAHGFPPGIGEWSKGPISFWLPNPKLTGKPWSLFPPGLYQRYRFSTPLNQFSFESFPIFPGDILYAFAEGDGDDHVFLVVDRDLGGRTYTVSNIIKMKPTFAATINYALLYDPLNPSAGVIKNEWSDLVNGRTGQNGFEIFRWKWLEKDLDQKQVNVTVGPGDTIDELAIRWKTPPEKLSSQISTTNRSSLIIGQVLTVPPQPLPDRFRKDLPRPAPDDPFPSPVSKKKIEK